MEKIKNTPRPHLTLLALSASSRQGIRDGLKELVSEACDFAEIQEKCRVARKAFSHEAACRLLCVLPPDADIGELLEQCRYYLNNEPAPNWRKKNIFFGENRRRGKIGFVFPGQGSQYAHMGADLLHCCTEPRNLLRQAEAALSQPNQPNQPNQPEQTNHLHSRMYPPPAKGKAEQKAQEEPLRQTQWAQPAIGVMSLIMLDLLSRFSVFPDAVCGHSYGELTALHAAGRMERDDFFRLSAARGRLMAEAARQGDAGRMMAVKTPIEKIPELIAAHGLDLILANRNGPDQGVLSGPSGEIEKMLAICRENHIRALQLPVSAAFHSRLVESAARPFRQALETVAFKPSDIPVYANTTGEPYPQEADSARELLGRHLLNPVNFIADIESMARDQVATFLEVGPKAALTGLIRSILKEREHTAIAVNESGGKQSSVTDLACALSQLAAAGHYVDLTQWPPLDAGG